MIENTLTHNLNQPTKAENEEPPLHAICIDNGTEDPDATEHLVEAYAMDPKTHFENRVVVALIRGGFTKQTDRLVEVYGEEDAGGRVMVMEDPNMAVGYFLHLLEIYDFPEPKAKREVRQRIPELYESYETWLASQTVRDRRLRLLDQAEQDVQYDSFYKPVLDSSEARWREVTGLSSRDTRRLAAAISDVEANPKFCYKNARLVVEELWDDEHVQYVEGIALSQHAVRITGHAWVEVDGVVAEVTWPWHQPDPADTGAVYYGVEVSREMLEEMTGHIGPDEDIGPLLLEIDDASRLG